MVPLRPGRSGFRAACVAPATPGPPFLSASMIPAGGRPWENALAIHYIVGPMWVKKRFSPAHR